MRKYFATLMVCAICNMGPGAEVGERAQPPQTPAPAYFELFGYSLFGRLPSGIDENSTSPKVMPQIPAAQILAQDFAIAEQHKRGEQHVTGVLTAIGLAEAKAVQQAVSGTVEIEQNKPRPAQRDLLGFEATQQGEAEPEPTATPTPEIQGGVGCSDIGCTTASAGGGGCATNVEKPWESGAGTTPSGGVTGEPEILTSPVPVEPVGTDEVPTLAAPTESATSGGVSEQRLVPEGAVKESVPSEGVPRNDGPFQQDRGRRSVDGVPFEAPTTHDFLGVGEGRGGVPVTAARTRKPAGTGRRR